MPKNVLNTAIEFFKQINTNDEVTIKFKKKDGSVRVMNCTLNFDKIPKKKQPKKVRMDKILSQIANSGVIHVFDLDKQEWRSVNFETAEWLETDDNVKYTIKK